MTGVEAIGVVVIVLLVLVAGVVVAEVGRARVQSSAELVIVRNKEVQTIEVVIGC